MADELSHEEIMAILPDPESEDISEEEMFFKRHGVGEYSVDNNFKEIDYLIDKTKANFKEREFVRHMVNGHTQTEAYLRAFDTTGEGISRSAASYSASRLLKRKRVKEYYYECIEAREKLAEETLPTLIEELNEDRKLARDVGQPSAAIAAVKAKANLLGLENQNNTNHVTINVIDEDAKNKLLDRMLKRRMEDSSETIDVDFEEIPND